MRKVAQRSCDGRSPNFTYDAIGNPKTYRDGMSFTWQGRQMKTAKTTSGTSVSYKYNADGLRTYKKVGSTVHQYEYSGDKLFYEKRGDIKFYYRYDVNGNLMSVTRLKADGTKFTLYAVCNSRGDVEELRKEDGTIYARYGYDSWGNVLHIYSGTGTTEITSTANLAVQNPFRYRGYYFDTESGLYYLQSRYYDPVTGRFVNPDSLVDNSDVLGFNLYAYCANNPVNYSDPTGYSKLIVLGFILVCALIGGVLAYNSDEKLYESPKKKSDTTVKKNNPSSKSSTTSKGNVLTQSNAQAEASSNKQNINNYHHNDSVSIESSAELTTKDRLINATIGASFGVAVGGLFTSFVGAGATLAYASTTKLIPLLGVTGPQLFAIGAIAYNVVVMIFAPALGIQTDAIEYEIKYDAYIY